MMDAVKARPNENIAPKPNAETPQPVSKGLLSRVAGSVGSIFSAPGKLYEWWTEPGEEMKNLETDCITKAPLELCAYEAPSNEWFTEGSLSNHWEIAVIQVLARRILNFATLRLLDIKKWAAIDRKAQNDQLSRKSAYRTAKKEQLWGVIGGIIGMIAGYVLPHLPKFAGNVVEGAQERFPTMCSWISRIPGVSWLPDVTDPNTQRELRKQANRYGPNIPQMLGQQAMVVRTTGEADTHGHQALSQTEQEKIQSLGGMKANKERGKEEIQRVFSAALSSHEQAATRAAAAAS